MRKLAVGLVLVMLLTGCADTTSTPSATPTPSATRSASPSPTPKPTPTPQPVSYVLSCRDANFKTVVGITTLEAAWASPTPVPNCEATISGAVPSDIQTQALTVSGLTDQRAGLKRLYELCATIHVSSYGQFPHYAASQVQELLGAFTLCPGQPAAGTIGARIQAEAQAEAERAAGTRIGPGVKQIGVTMQPGTWVAEGQISDCYWEMLDGAGNILDNNFLGQALRVEVSIPAEVFSFSSTGCGEWTFAG